jgi:hypothetical protein
MIIGTISSAVRLVEHIYNLYVFIGKHYVVVRPFAVIPAVTVKILYAFYACIFQ